MSARPFVLSLTTYLVVSALACHATVTKPKLLTAEQAEVRAREFCKQVDWTPVGKPKFKLDRGYSDYGVWEVEFPEKGRTDNTIDVSVDRLRGVIRWAWSDSARDRLELSNKVTLTDKQAEEAALKFLKIAGADMKEAKLEGITKESNTWPESDLRLEVSYRRYYKGIQFAGDGAGVSLDPRDGALVDMHYHFGSPVPEKITAAVEKDAAVKTAAEYIKDKREIDGLKSVELLIVQPDMYDEDYRRQKDGPMRSHLAWWVTFIWDRAHEADVVIDAETGEVLTWSSCM